MLPRPQYLLYQTLLGDLADLWVVSDALDVAQSGGANRVQADIEFSVRAVQLLLQQHQGPRWVVLVKPDSFASWRELKLSRSISGSLLAGLTSALSPL